MACEVISVVEKICSKLDFLCVPYLPFVFCLSKEKGKLETKMKAMEAKLLQAEKQEQNSSAYKELVGNIRFILFDAEDLVEELSLIEARRQLNNGNRNIADMVVGFLSTLPSHIVIAFKMKQVSDRLTEEEENYNKLPLVEPDSNQDTREQPQCYVPADMFIGRDDDKKKIKALLQKPSAKKNVSTIPNVSIIPIYGIGGLGKTTLARSVYDDIGKDFEVNLWAWVSSAAFDVKAIVKKLIESQTRKACEVTDMNQLGDGLREILNGKKYLLVLDDVWNTNHGKWDDLKRLLMGGASGSVILVTTRTREVAGIMADTGSSYQLQGLSSADGKSLFEQLAFGQLKKNSELESIGEKIVEKCGGHPLAITTIAGLLSDPGMGSAESTKKKWEKVEKQLFKPAEEGDEMIHTSMIETLKISYDQLPHYLKRCFAYCSLFPKGSEMEKATLIQLWMAQGFIEASEDMGDECFDKLLKRCFFDVVKRDDYDNVVSCKMHDLMHALAQKAAGASYVIVNEGVVGDPKRVIHSSLPLTSPIQIPTSLLPAMKLRTFFLIDQKIIDHIPVVGCNIDKLSSIFKYLRALKLEINVDGLESSDVLNSIGDLKLLRYLDLSYSKIRKVPDSVCELQNLQTLKLNICRSLVELPRDITKLVSLRHLENCNCSGLQSMPLGLGNLTCIRTLPLFVLGSSGGGMSELEGLKNLSGDLKIKILDKVSRNEDSRKGMPLKEKENLQALELLWYKVYEDEDDELLEAFEPNPNLKELEIYGYGGVRFPSWMFNGMQSLSSLVKLTISRWPKLTSISFLFETTSFHPSFFTLPKLKSLEILWCRNLVSLPEGWLESLTSLEYLEIHHCDELQSLSRKTLQGFTSAPDMLMPSTYLKGNDDGSQGFTNLHYLDLSALPRLTSLPNQLQHAAKLKELWISGCPYLEETCQKETGDDWPKIKHIPNIRISWYVARNVRLKEFFVKKTES